MNGHLSSARSGDGAGAVGVDIAILDTGIDETHPDLNVVGGYDCTGAPRSRLEGRPRWHDFEGHGTIVAGVAAAKDNGFGVVGVAPGARLWAVKVFRPLVAEVPGADGTDEDAFTSGGVTFNDGDMMCGFEWVAKHAKTIDVANASIEHPTPGLAPCDGKVQDLPDAGTGVADTSLHPLFGSTLRHRLGDSRDFLMEAACGVVRAGVPLVASAGNSARDPAYATSVPQSIPAVTLVSAIADFDGKPGGLAGSHQSCAGFYFPAYYEHLPSPFNAYVFRIRNGGARPNDVLWDLDDTPADFSNHGKLVDLAAPGVCVLSTGLSNTYMVGDGTSFASPAVAGAAALYKNAHPRRHPPRSKPRWCGAGR